MSDAEIRDLVRAMAASINPRARYLWRLALVRAGRGGEAGIEVGDVVEVGEMPGRHEWFFPVPFRGVVTLVDDYPFLGWTYVWPLLWPMIHGPADTYPVDPTRSLTLVRPAAP